MAGTSDIKYCECEELDYTTGLMVDKLCDGDVATPVFDWRKYTAPVFLGAMFAAGTSGIAIGDQSVDVILGAWSGVSCNEVAFVGNTAEMHNIVSDDISVPALRHAGVLRGHFSKPQKLQFSADLLD